MSGTEHDTLARERHPWARPVVDAIAAVGDRHWRRIVAPLVARAAGPDLGPKVVRKLRFLTCNLYSAGSLTALLLSGRRPRMLEPLVLVARLPSVDERALARVASLCLRALGRLALTRECERVVIVGAFIAAIDHAFDHALEHWSPAERGERMHALLRREWQPDRGLLGLVAALRERMEAGLDARARARFAPALAKCHAWVDAEVRSLTRAPDPAGLSHRLAGVDGTIAGIAFPLGEWLDARAVDWMIACSLFVQMFDDWVDRAQDAAAGRETPALTGAWTWASVESQWDVTVQGVAPIVRAVVAPRGPLADFATGVYVEAMYDVMRAMVVGIAD
ncbi:MAG: hypothetical protein IT385_22355 [Deltaproteobacteria bacterium]|nr:hypothetical protein [Deltaproteobacteria bacterium]